MPGIRAAFWIGALSAALSAQTFTVGGGAPSAAVTQAFQAAYQRNGFSGLAGAALENVTSYGPTGLIQTFKAATGSGAVALLKPDTTATQNVYQLTASMYAYFITVGVTTAGYATADTTACPALLSGAGSGDTCVWQPFSLDYALFVYSRAVNGSATYALSDPYYTKWLTAGGISGAGPLQSAQATVTSKYGTTATRLLFDQGAIYATTSGLRSGQTFLIKEPVYDVFLSYQGDIGSFGLPVCDLRAIAGGTLQQAFERGAIEYSTSVPKPVVRPAVGSVQLTPGGSLQLSPGATGVEQITLAAMDGTPIVDRPVIWTSTNPYVVQSTPSGMTSVLTARGFGTADVFATVEGLSGVVIVTVSGTACCQVGGGAPSSAIQQAIQAVVTRDALQLQLPAAAGVTRVGNGYVQQFLGSSVPAVPYLIAVPDSTGAGSLVAGAILAQYYVLGGPAGPLGYPLSDATAGGRQIFENAALAGSPVQLVSGTILSKWKALGYETGSAGSPVAASAAFVTFAGTSGAMQSFQNGQIYAPSLGSLAGKSFFVTGLVLAAYASSSGASGALGSPITDERLLNGRRRQDFEGGYIDYAPGDALAVAHTSTRQPQVFATPASVPVGSSVHLVMGGFNNGATVRVSQTGQADFLVTVAKGTYAWDVWVPASASAGAVTVKATDSASGASSQSTYAVYAPVAVSLSLAVVSGDKQTGAPGAQLAQPLVVAVTDQNGNPLKGQTVVFNAVPGAVVTPGSVVTGSDGRAAATLRLPPQQGVVLATAQAGSKLVTFSAQSAAVSLTNFPALTQSVAGPLGGGSDTISNQGALVTAAASILRYHQLRGELPEPNGLADPATLAAFLSSFCTADSKGNRICDGFVSLVPNAHSTVNLWRVGAFAGNNVIVSVETPSLNAVADLVNAGWPVLLALSIPGLGSHFVVADGVASDGSILIADPNPAFAQADLNGYLNGFAAGSQSIQATLAGAIRLLPASPNQPGFLVASNAPASVSSTSGTCGQPFAFPDTPAVAGASPTLIGGMYLQPCGGSAAFYELDVAAAGAYGLVFTDLSPGGSRVPLSGATSASYGISGGSGQWSVAPLAAQIVGGVVNSASYTNQIAPGSLVSIFGLGLAAGAPATTVKVNGESARVLAAFPFQVNTQIPLDIPAGQSVVSVTSGAASSQIPATVSSLAPAIFSTSAGQANIANSDGSINSPSNPATRGSAIVVYATGLGAVSGSGAALAPVSVVAGGVVIPASSATMAASTSGLYQVKVTLPSTIPPGLYLPLYLQQGTASSNIVSASVQ